MNSCTRLQPPNTTSHSSRRATTTPLSDQSILHAQPPIDSDSTLDHAISAPIGRHQHSPVVEKCHAVRPQQTHYSTIEQLSRQMRPSTAVRLKLDFTGSKTIDDQKIIDSPHTRSQSTEATTERSFAYMDRQITDRSFRYPSPCLVFVFIFPLFFRFWAMR